jgi:hypothetical protein
MKLIVSAIAFASLVFFSCSKDYSIESVPSVLHGTWRMIEARDNGSASITTKPSDLHGDVEITFTPSGNASGLLTGFTATNIISASGYATGKNQMLTIPALNMTKLWETPWGNEFVANILSAFAYHFDNDGNLVIITANKTLIFERV